MGNSEWAKLNEKSVSGGIAAVKCEEECVVKAQALPPIP